MAAVIPSVQDILSLDLIPIVLNTTYEIEAFVMGYHVYKNTWTPFVGEALDVAMQPDNKMDLTYFKFYLRFQVYALLISQLQV